VVLPALVFWAVASHKIGAYLRERLPVSIGKPVP
jgi:hypothetical protein